MDRVIVWITISFCAYLFVVLSLVHFEVRYLFLPNFFFFQMAALLVASDWKKRTLGRAPLLPAWAPAGP